MTCHNNDHCGLLLRFVKTVWTVELFYADETRRGDIKLSAFGSLLGGYQEILVFLGNDVVLPRLCIAAELHRRWMQPDYVFVVNACVPNRCAGLSLVLTSIELVMVVVQDVGERDPLFSMVMKMCYIKRIHVLRQCVVCSDGIIDLKPTVEICKDTKIAEILGKNHVGRSRRVKAVAGASFWSKDIFLANESIGKTVS